MCGAPGSIGGLVAGYCMPNSQRSRRSVRCCRKILISWSNMRRAWRELVGLNSHMLRDIGFDREKLYSESGKCPPVEVRDVVSSILYWRYKP
jgi:uncharacterized protein YjiS (DUF1127 family)